MSRSPAQPDAPERNGAHPLARALVGAAAAAMLVWGAWGVARMSQIGVQTALPSDTTNLAFVVRDDFDCFQRVLEERVPRGAVVALGDLTSTGDVASWSQRLSEFLFPLATVTDDPAKADYIISIVPSAQRPCRQGDVAITPTQRS